MPPDRPPPGSPDDWLRHARSDLAFAQISPPEEGLLEALCFHAQQAAEKSIKAVLILHGIPVPKTHNLTALLALLRPLLVPEEVEAATILSVYAAVTRYPGAFDPIGETEYLQAVMHARNAVTWAEKAVGGRGSSGLG